MELLVAIAMASVVLFALLQVFVGTLKADARTEDRVASTASVRLGLERVVSALDSQVCADPITPPIVAGSTASVLTYYADSPAPSTTATPTADGAHAERLTFNATAGTVVLQRWSGTSTSGTPATTRTVAQGVGVPASSAGPFTYFEYGSTNGAPDAKTEQAPPLQAAVSGSPLTGTVGAIVRVHVTLVGRAIRGSTESYRSAPLEGDAYAGSLDPLQPDLGPRCAA